MHLKQIEMENFKTFRKKVTVPIYKGFTGITGPNGSGKSNIADAVLFVLGPRSSKTVRAKRLEDLIFHGNDRFKAAKECKVTLVFDNSDRMIPIDSDQVSLKRIIRRSSTDPNNILSYFYVNGRTSSQGQFESILTHANLSAEGYNIVLQGHIGEFISKTPVKIREEIDEIAGIRRYDDEIKAAHRKKDRTEENMERIGWLLDQIKIRLRELKKEKEEAEKYKDAKERINRTKALLFHLQEQAINTELSSYQGAIDNAEKEKVRLRQEMEKLESERSSLDAEISEVEEKIEDITGEEGRKLKTKLDTARLELMRARDVIETAEDTISEMEGESRLRAQERKDIEKKIRSLEKETEECKKELSKVMEGIEKRKNEIRETEEDLARSDMDLLEIRRDLGKASKELEKGRDILSKSILERDRISNTLESKSSSLADLEQMTSTLTFETKDLEREISEIEEGTAEEKVKKLQKEYYDARSEEKLLGERMQALEREITSLNRLYTQMKVELETSEKLQKGVSMAVDDIMSARDKGEIRGIIGTVGELGDVPEEYSAALEVAAGGRISAVVVEDDSVAAKCIDRLKKNRKGRATFLPLNKLSSRRPGAKALMVTDDPHVVGMAVDLIKFDPKFEKAFKWAFGDTVVVDDLGSLRRLMGGVRLVTLDGEIAGAGGDITGGTSRGKKRGPGFGKRSRGELEDVSEKLKDKMAEADSLTETLKETRKKVSELESEIRGINSRKEDLSSRKKRTEEALRKSRELLESRQGSMKSIRSEVEDLERTLEEAEKKTEELQEKVEELVSVRDEKQEELESSTPKSIREKLRSMREDQDELVQRRTELAEMRDSAKAQKEMFVQRLKDLDRRDSEIKETVSKAKKEKENAVKKEERFSKEVKALEAVLASIESKTKDLYEKLNSLGRQVERVQGKREKARTDLLSQDQTIITQRTNIRIAQDKLADLMTEKQPYADLELPEPPYPAEKELIREVRDLENILENAGNVNLKALEEYEDTEAKKKEISEEMRALRKEKEELERLISEIDDKRRTEFLHVFHAVDKNFREIYAEISSGGEAYFHLENEEDPLSGGLNMHVRPQGKKMTRLGALSGGEKSLASMAFIFAVQAWDPSPVYLLDEVDQNLDSVNAEIVARMVRKNSSFAQFILISLRKISLKEAHHLYGVTLQRGESVVLGRVDLKDVETYEKGDGQKKDTAEASGGGGMI